MQPPSENSFIANVSSWNKHQPGDSMTCAQKCRLQSTCPTVTPLPCLTPPTAGGLDDTIDLTEDGPRLRASPGLEQVEDEEDEDMSCLEDSRRSRQRNEGIQQSDGHWQRSEASGEDTTISGEESSFLQLQYGILTQIIY